MKKVLLGILIGIIIGAGSLFLYNKFYIEKNNSIKKETEEKKETKKEIKESDNLLSENEALKVGNELWQYAFNTSWGKTFKPDLELITNYEEVKSYFTDDFYANNSFSETNYEFDEFFGIVKNQDGSIYSYAGSRGGDQQYLDTKLLIKNNSQNEIIFKAISNYCDGSIYDDSSECASKKISETKEQEFVIKKIDNEWKIKYFYLPN